MSYYNAEHYPDPTAWQAQQNIDRRINKRARAYLFARAPVKGNTNPMNAGKQFETDVRNSVKKIEDLWFYRFRDGTASYYGGQAQDGIRFQQSNICDCEIFRTPCLHLMELKTTAGGTLPFKNIIGEDGKKIDKLKDLAAAAAKPGMTAGLLWNCRINGHTYWIDARTVLEFIENPRQDRKSLPEFWAIDNGIRVDGRKLQVNWRYDVDGLIQQLEKVGG